MKRSWRLLLNIAAVVSLFIWIVFAAIWFRGFWATENLTYVRQQFEGTVCISRWTSLDFDCNQITFSRREFSPQPIRPPEIPELASANIQPYSGLEHVTDPRKPFAFFHGDRSDPITHRLGFTYKESKIGPDWMLGYSEKEWAIPFWLPLILLAILPAYKLSMIQQWRRNRRQKQGRCVICGYDLRATPERCPECGAVPTGFPGVSQ